jgi:hypothetical protein
MFDHFLGYFYIEFSRSWATKYLDTLVAVCEFISASITCNGAAYFSSPLSDRNNLDTFQLSGRACFI